jgi:hypothetical protein
MNWYIIIPIGFTVIALIVFLMGQNVKDEKEYEDFSNNDYLKELEFDHEDM